MNDPSVGRLLLAHLARNADSRGGQAGQRHGCFITQNISGNK
jgi:hypothetical protein